MNPITTQIILVGTKNNLPEVNQSQNASVPEQDAVNDNSVSLSKTVSGNEERPAIVKIVAKGNRMKMNAIHTATTTTTTTNMNKAPNRNNHPTTRSTTGTTNGDGYNSIWMNTGKYNNRSCHLKPPIPLFGSKSFEEIF